MRIENVTERLDDLRRRITTELDRDPAYRPHYKRAVLARITESMDQARFVMDDENIPATDPFTALSPAAQSVVAEQVQCAADVVTAAHLSNLVPDQVEHDAQQLAVDVDALIA